MKTQTLIKGLAAMVFFLTLSVTAYAEAADCSGSIKGTTQAGNINTGRTYFDSHPDPSSGDAPFADLSIALGAGAKGYAPADRGYAACAKTAGSATAYGRTSEYSLKGWSWNDNIGFLSFSCRDEDDDGDKENLSGSGGVSCGGIEYGVHVGPVVSGARQLFGYAWSPSFGWVQFDNDAGIDYGVILAADGTVSGYAWTEAGVYMNFRGIKIELPVDGVDNDPDEKVVDWCDNRSYICAEIDPDPRRPRYDSGGKVIVGTDDGVKLADGTDGFRVHLYLRAGDGVTPMSAGGFTNYTAFTNSIRLVWEDTVKMDQRQGVAPIDVSGTMNPWAANTGAVVYKPLTFANFMDDPADPDASHFISRALVRSLAPTSESNVSLTSGTSPKYPVNNEKPVFDNGLGEVAPNQLILKRIEFGDLTDAGGVVLRAAPVYPNGRENLFFRFKPAIEVGTLYVNDFKDQIMGYRSLPENVKVGTNVLSAASSFNAARASANATFNLGFDVDGTTGEDSECGADSSFVFRFMKYLNGSDTPASPIVSSLSALTSTLLSAVDVQILAELTFTGDEPPCDTVQSPYLYSVINYAPEAGKNIYYLSNHLPRIAPGAANNPAAIIHGNIYAQKIANVQKNRVLESSGFINKDTVRDSIYRNIKKYVRVKPGIVEGGECMITSLAAGATIGTYDGDSCADKYDVIVVGNEKVIYFKGSDVTMSLAGGRFSGDWVVISDGGNIFIDKDIYNADKSGNMALIALHDPEDDEYTTGNIYLAPCDYNVKNIQGAIFADGAVFSYNGDHNDRDLLNNGAPVFDNEMERLDLFACQLKIEGSVSSDNTIGGADMDTGSEPKDYLLIGGGRTVEVGDFDTKMMAQSYDINYLRLFRLGIEMKDGLPVDQRCKKELTPEEIKSIAGGAKICGDREPCNLVTKLNVCDGINPLKKYSPIFVAGSSAGPDGDRVVVTDAGALAKGLKNNFDGIDGTADDGTQFDPIYIFYDQTVNNSFIFQGGAGTKIGQ